MPQNLTSLLASLDHEFCSARFKELVENPMDFSAEARLIIEEKNASLRAFVCGLRDCPQLGIKALQGATIMLAMLLKKEGIPASVSYHAGTYVCNHVFYVLLRALRHQPRIPAGFVHLPPIKRLLGRGLSEKKMMLAVRTMLTVLAKDATRTARR